MFHIPVYGVSARGTTLSAFHWGEKSKNDDYKLLKSRLIKYGEMSRESFMCIENWEDMRPSLSANQLIDFPREYNNLRLTYRKDKSGVCDSLCSHIRNAFAHGSLAFYLANGETYIVMEDIDKQRTVTARMILSKTVLYRWMRIIQLGPFKSDAELDKEFSR